MSINVPTLHYSYLYFDKEKIKFGDVISAEYKSPSKKIPYNICVCFKLPKLPDEFTWKDNLHLHLIRKIMYDHNDIKPPAYESCDVKMMSHFSAPSTIRNEALNVYVPLPLPPNPCKFQIFLGIEQLMNLVKPRTSKVAELDLNLHVDLILGTEQ